MKIKNVTFGADPEVFVKTATEVASSEGLFGGTKDEPMPISSLGHSIQEDNILVEFNIPPSKDKKEFVNNINYCLNYIKESASLYDLDIHISASEIVDRKYLMSDQARTFGCEPDYNAYTRKANPRPVATDSSLRSAGGHLHIGYDNPNEETSVNLIKYLDIYIGLYSLFLDTDDRRKELYGKAGAYRIKPFGVEYRTPSNFWLEDNSLMEFMIDSANKAIDAINNEIDIFEYIEEKEIIRAINDNDNDLATLLIAKIEEIEKFKKVKS